MGRLLLRRARRTLVLLASLLLATPASATWSIVFVNNATGEVAVATATCIPDEDLRKFVPVVWVGVGAGAAQYIVDPQARNRKIIRNGLRSGRTPAEILDDLVYGSGITPGRRQYGVAALTGPAATWTGGQVDPGKGEVTGRVGDITYAIQGNSLTGPEVVFAAQEALRNAQGDSGERMLTAMLAAARLGGDGRCSCSFNDPTACGAPPDPARKSAHVAVMIVARMGDTNGTCNAQDGCANGDYYLDLEFLGGAGDPDPILELARIHEGWRRGLRGRPDHLLSRVAVSADRLRADGESTLDVRVRLADLEGTPLPTGGATLTVAPADPGATPLVDVGPVTDHGDGTYSLRLRAGTLLGEQELAITADDGVARATLYPYLRVSLVPPAPLVAGFEEVSLSARTAVPFRIEQPAAPGGTYLLLGSASGTRPGFGVAGLSVPLNPDAWFVHTLTGGPDLVDTFGRLDANGRAVASWRADPALLATSGGTRLSWAALIHDGRELFLTDVVAVELGP